MTCRTIRRADGRRLMFDGATRKPCLRQHCLLCGTHVEENYCCPRHLRETVDEIGMLLDLLAQWTAPGISTDPPAALPHQRLMCWQSNLYYSGREVLPENSRPPAPDPAQLVGWWADIWRDFDGDALTVERTGTLVAPYNYLAENVERVGQHHPGFALFVHDLRYALEWIDHAFWCGPVYAPRCALYQRTHDEPWIYHWWVRLLDTIPYFDSQPVRCHGIAISAHSTQRKVASSKDVHYA